MGDAVPCVPCVPCVRIALVGFGNVGQALARLLLAKHGSLQFEVKVVGIATGSHGTVVNLEGLDLERCLTTLEGQGTSLPDAEAMLRHVEGHCDAEPRYQYIEGSLEVKLPTWTDGKAEVLEAMNAAADGQPALSILEQAFMMEPPAHAITASKAPVALAYQRLKAFALKRGRRFLFESSVMDGVPIFSLLRQLPGVKVKRFVGVLNSTTNLVLTRMRRENCSLWDAVAFAQQEGIAERDPSDDLDGKDAATKLAVLSAAIFGCQVNPAEIPADSIRNVTLEQVHDVAARGHTLKVVCEATLAEGHVETSVLLKELPWQHPLANLDGASAALTFETDVMGPITVTSTDPTTMDTAYGMLQDLQVAMLGDGCGGR